MKGQKNGQDKNKGSLSGIDLAKWGSWDIAKMRKISEYDGASFSWMLQCWHVKWRHDGIPYKQIPTNDYSLK